MNNLNVCQLFLIFSFSWPTIKEKKNFFQSLKWKDINQTEERDGINKLFVKIVKRRRMGDVRVEGQSSWIFFDDLCWKLCESSESLRKAL